MTTPEKVKKIRDITMSSFNKINAALTSANGDVDKAIEILIQQNQTSTADIAARVADNNIVYSYVHNNKIGAMIVLGCQTDFVARNEVFLGLAKDICMHIVSAPIQAEYVDEMGFSKETLDEWKVKFAEGTNGKPPQIVEKIVLGKLKKKIEEVCLVNQKFVKNDEITIAELIAGVSTTLGEKIQIKKFVRMVASA